MAKERIPVEVRFWAKINKNGPVLVTDLGPCWEWIGATHSAGYGLLGRGGKDESLIRATHVSWKIHTGQSVPKGMFVCHKCDNPPCTNPEHLFVGSPKDNLADARAKGRWIFSLKPRYALSNNLGKVTDEQVREIRRRAKVGLPGRRWGRIEFWQSLADEFGLKRKYVQQLCSEHSSYRNLNDR